MQTLFAWDFNGKKNDDVDALVDENFANFAPQFDDGGFVHETIKNILEHSEEIDNYIRRYATEWPLEQINKVDLAILRLAIWELTIKRKEPPKVIIDEAIELGKTFGSEKSSSFINGVLGTVFKNLKWTSKN